MPILERKFEASLSNGVANAEPELKMIRKRRESGILMVRKGNFMWLPFEFYESYPLVDGKNN